MEAEESLLVYEPPEALPGPPPDTSQIRKKPLLPPLETKPTIADILNGIFPPVFYEHQGKWFRKCVSAQEPSRSELKSLQHNLQHKLERRQAARYGICPIREDVHNELLDELIRQCTINCPERGLLLMRVRDNLKMTFASYQTLYQGSYIYGNRKAFAAEQEIPELDQRIQDVRRRIVGLKNRKAMLETELETTEKSFREINAAEEKRRGEQLQYLKETMDQFNTFLSGYR